MRHFNIFCREIGYQSIMAEGFERTPDGYSFFVVRGGESVTLAFFAISHLVSIQEVTQ